MSLPRPPGYLPPPRPAVADVVRTARVLLTDVASHFVRLARDRSGALLTTRSEEGLSRIRDSFGATLVRFGIDLEVIHRERVPPEGGLVFMWNQESHLDHLALPVAVPRPFFSLFNNELARVPFYGPYLREAGHVHVDRTDETRWRRSVAQAATRAREGECVLVSPEGTRSWDGRLLPMKRGALELAVLSGCPVVCVTVIGGHARLPRGSPVVRAGRMRVVLGAPLIPVGHDKLAAEVAATFERTKLEFAL